MTLIKRGLGRGLEVLLADVSSLAGMEQNSAAANEMDGQLALAQKLIESLREENRILLKEAETLNNLLLELEVILKSDLN